MSFTSIQDLLKINSRFLRSVNLERDFDDAQSLDGYIVTEETSRNLRRLGEGFRQQSGQRAWRITGDFGSGKSSFALALANLVGRSRKELPVEIRSLREQLNLSRNFKEPLTVLVTGSREPLAVAILRGIQTSLNRTIDGRKKLSARDKIAAAIASGHVADSQAVSLVEQISRELVSKELAGGVILIVDELGKFLEYAALNPEKQDVYFLQQIAECASRSGPNPIHLVGLLHQGFTDYAEKLSGTAQLEWAKVSERFEEISFSQPLGQVVTLIAAALALDSESEHLRGWKKRSRELMTEVLDLGMYGPTAARTALIQAASALYPLHPAVIPVLSRFFRRFGQNERSLFSFLLSSEPYALQDFATREASPNVVYRLADFYDFAANNFSQRLSGQSFRSHWNHIDARIRSAENEPLEIQQLLKTVGILNVIAAAELCPTEAIVNVALGQPGGTTTRLRDLVKRGILFNRGKAGYSLWPHASVNLEQRIEEAREKLTHASPIATVAREKLDACPIVARRHYILTGNLRYFDVRFVTATEFTAEASGIRAVYPASGIVIVVLCESETERQASILWGAKAVHSAEQLVAISAPLDALTSSALELERWEWVERNTPELKDDRFAAEEVSRQIAASRQLLDAGLQQLVGFRNEADASSETPGVAWYYAGQADPSIGRTVRLQSFLSDLCDRLYDKAPSVRNELINRHVLSSAAASARQKLFKAMLEDAAEPKLSLPEDKAPPEKSIYLSVLEAGRLHRETDGIWGIVFPKAGRTGDPLQFRPALDAVMTRLEKVPDQRVPVSELYELLRSSPYGVRDGLIPILLLVVFIVHETEIAVYEDDVFQPEIEEYLMMRLVKAPETFEFQLCRITGLRKTLITELASTIESKESDKSRLLSVVRPLYSFVAGLPDYVRNTDQLSIETLALRKAIEAAREPAQLIFRDIPKAFGIDLDAKEKVDTESLAKKIGLSIAELRQSFEGLQKRMAELILDAFQAKGPLEAWRSAIAGTAETLLVGLGDPDFRAFCLKLGDAELDEPEWLESLGSLLTRRPPSRWNDRDEVVFRERIYAFADQFNRVLSTCFLKDGSLPETAIRLAVTPRSGVEKHLVFCLTSDQSREMENLLLELRKHIPKDKSQISLAALSRLLWDNLSKEK
ncbi:hypothetical protein [Verrucomicrobium sp. BvORR106]|uniref:hypothetical protein n=1 Tax=Verrucomicrobium sp. BvORR106 TaxID=1403819 RepID=UPI00057206CE|nr:hypothetical protein [Verrucomicrobium sp. BvORR106]